MVCSADDESTAIEAAGSSDDGAVDVQEKELDPRARAAAIDALELDEFLCEARLSPDRAYVAQWDSQLTALLRDKE